MPVEHSGDGRDRQHTDARVCEGRVGSAIGGGSDRQGARHVENGAAHDLRHHRKEPGLSCYTVRASAVPPHLYDNKITPLLLLSSSSRARGFALPPWRLPSFSFLYRVVYRVQLSTGHTSNESTRLVILFSPEGEYIFPGFSSSFLVWFSLTFFFFLHIL